MVGTRRNSVADGQATYSQPDQMESVIRHRRKKKNSKPGGRKPGEGKDLKGTE